MLEWTSTNGRWGLTLLCPEDQKFPAEGSIESLGELGGMSCFKFTPGKTGLWLVIGDDLVPVKGTGAEIAGSCGLQSYKSVTLLICRPGGTWKWHGYKRRQSGFCSLNSEGKVQESPPAVLLEAGVIEPEIPAEVITPPPEVESSMASAMRKAGLI